MGIEADHRSIGTGRKRICLPSRVCGPTAANVSRAVATTYIQTPGASAPLAGEPATGHGTLFPSLTFPGALCDKATPLTQGSVEHVASRRLVQLRDQFQQMTVGIFEKDGSRWHPTVNDRFVHWPLHRSTWRMDRLDAALAQIRDHLVNIRARHTERNVIFRRVPVNYRVDAKKSKHPARLAIRVKQQGTRFTSLTEPQLEPKLVDVELDGPVDVRYREVNLIETVMEPSRTIQSTNPIRGASSG
jgi:hypothetical protein